MSNKAASRAEAVSKVVVHFSEGGERGGGVSADGKSHSEKAEYGRALYCNAKNSRHVQGGREEAGGTGGYAVVGTGGTRPGRGKGYGGGGGRQGRDGVIEGGGLKRKTPISGTAETNTKYQTKPNRDRV